MTYFKKHLFFCTNQRDAGRRCCNNANATDLCLYAKQRIRELELGGENGVRVSSSGCMGRCAKGPNLVIYPEGTWYNYKNEKDIDEIIERHVQHGEIVNRLLVDQ